MTRLLHLVRPGANPARVADGDVVVYTHQTDHEPFALHTDAGPRPLSGRELAERILAAERVVVW